MIAHQSHSTFLLLDPRDGTFVSADGNELRCRFAEEGVLVLPGFLGEGELQPLRRELEAHYRPLHENALQTCRSGEKTNKFACDVIPWDPVKEGNPAFQELARNPVLARVTEEVLGPGFTAPGSLAMFSVGGGRGQAWHQDCPSETDDARAFNLNRLFYIETVTLEDGAIVVVPGSHRQGRIPPGDAQEPMEGEWVLTPEAGTLVLLHGHVYHRVTPNHTPRPRLSVNFRAFPAGTSPDVTCIGVYRNGSVNFCDKPKMHDGTPAPMR